MCEDELALSVRHKIIPLLPGLSSNSASVLKERYTSGVCGRCQRATMLDPKHARSLLRASQLHILSTPAKSGGELGGHVATATEEGVAD